MANAQKQKGTRWETARADWWRSQGFEDARRVALHGSADCGDLWITQTMAGPVLEECKNVGRLAIPEWLRQGSIEAENAGAWLCPVAFKLRGVGLDDPGRHPVALWSEDWAAVLRHIEGLEDRVSALRAENAALRERRYWA